MILFFEVFCFSAGRFFVKAHYLADVFDDRRGGGDDVSAGVARHGAIVRVCDVFVLGAFEIAVG